jgi:hypothetical protein
MASADQETDEWRATIAVHQRRLWLTAQEAAELGSRLEELLGRYADRLAAPELRPPDARLIALMGWVVPDGPPLGTPVEPRSGETAT